MFCCSIVMNVLTSTCAIARAELSEWFLLPLSRVATDKSEISCKRCKMTDYNCTETHEYLGPVAYPAGRERRAHVIALVSVKGLKDKAEKLSRVLETTQ